MMWADRLVRSRRPVGMFTDYAGITAELSAAIAIGLLIMVLVFIC
jgi:hypothetical protein